MKIKIAVEVDTQAEALDVINKLYGAKASITIPQTTPQQEYAAKLAASHEDEEDAAGGEDVTGQLDSEGFPWDARIHSSSKKKKGNGAWVARRGVTESTYNAVIAELRGQTTLAPIVAPATHQFQPQPVYQPVPAQFFEPGTTIGAGGGLPHIPQQLPPAQPVIQPQAVQGVPVTPEYQPAPVQQPQPVAQPVANTAPTITDWFNKLQQIMAMDQVGGQSYVNSVIQRVSQQFQVQVNSVNDITGQPAMIAFAMQLIALDGK